MVLNSWCLARRLCIRIDRLNSDGPDQHVLPQHMFSVSNSSDFVTVTKVYHISLNNKQWTRKLLFPRG